MSHQRNTAGIIASGTTEVWNEAQLDRLLEVISGDPLEDVILVGLATGARIGECLGLLWPNVDEKQHELHITGAVKRFRFDAPKDEKAYTYPPSSFRGTITMCL